MTTITLVDTSILCELLQVPGKSDPRHRAELVAEMDRRTKAGERLIIPVTAIIETGNHIAQCGGDRFRLARRLEQLLRSAVGDESPWLVLETRFDRAFVNAVCDGDSTGQGFADLAAAKIGAGDIALLVERDQLKQRSAIHQVRVWTLDDDLRARAEVAS